MDHVLELERQLARANTLDARMDALTALIWELREFDSLRALSLSQQLLRLAQTVPEDSQHNGDAHRCMASIQFTRGNTADALHHALKALNYVEKSGDRLGLMYTRDILGGCYLLLGDYPASQILYRQALSIAEELNITKQIGKLYKNIGVVMSNQGEYEEAIECYNRAVPYIEQLEDEGELAKIYNNYSVEYKQLGELDKALYWAQKAYHGFYTTARWRGLMHATINLAHIHAGKSNITHAIAYIQECIELAEKSNIQNDIILAYQNAGEIALLDHAPEAALDWFQRALEINNTIAEPNIVFSCHEGLYKAHKALGNFEEALHHHELFHQSKELIFNTNKATQWQNLEILHRTREARQEAHRQRALRDADHQYYARLNEMKDDFINSASHDLKNPLAMMKTSLYLIKRHGRIDDAKGQSHLNMLEKQVNWMRDLITNILDLAWLEMGRAIQTELVEAVTYFKQIVDEHQILAREKDISLQFLTSLDDLTTAVDTTQIRQVINNLLSNAIKYSPPGGKIQLELSSDDNLMQFEIADNGYGIPKKDLSSIFERFYRVNDARHQAEEGTGLGLSIVKSIIEQHGGTIEIDSEVDIGTTVRITIPLITVATQERNLPVA